LVRVVTESRDRQTYLDIAKGIGIFLVVYGHVQIGLHTAGLLKDSTLASAVIHTIYTVHMPLFFLVSGYLAHHSLSRKPASVAANEILVYLVLAYIFWSLVHLGLRYLFSDVVNRPMALTDVFTLWIPKDQFWFLFALAVCYCAALLCKITSISPWVCLAAAIATYWFRFDYGGIGYGLLYFSIGMLIAGHLGVIEPNDAWFRADAAIVCFGLFVVSVTFCETHGIYNRLDVVGALSGAYVIVFLSRYICWPIIRTMGEFSFYIFVMHVIFSSGLRAILKHGLHLKNVPLHLALGVLAGLAFPVLVGMAARRYGFNRYIFAR